MTQGSSFRFDKMTTKPNLQINLGGILMKNPVMVASGTFGYGPEYADLIDLNRLGAIVVKGISREPVLGNPPPRTVEVADGLINAIGLQNPGMDGFISEYMPFLRQYDVPVIVNIWGRSIEDYARVAERFDAVNGVEGLEVNVSCPNIKEGSHAFGSNLDMFKRVIDATRQKTKLTLIPKLAPDIHGIQTFAKAAEESGADAISLINSVPAMAIDIEERRPKLGNVTGGLSGPAIKPIAVKMVWEAAKAVNIPIVGIGGISCAADALEFLIAGATAVAIGTANFTDPATAMSVIEGIEAYLIRHDMKSAVELVRSLRS
jgi:dihydroorotate dehydrogenase (NAD+) catalytic subunit